jgi:TonB family protein
MSRADTLDRRQSLGAPLFGSVTIHAAIVASLLFAWTFRKPMPEFGDDKISHGTVGVNVVNTIPIPSKVGRENRLANDTDSVVPQAPPEKKEIKKAEVADPKAIPLPGKPLKPKPEQMRQPIYKPERIKPNQVYSHTPEALKSSQIAMQGNEGIGVGPNSVIGQRFGYYVDLMRTQIARHWSTAGLAGDTHRVLITFTILKDGTVKDPKIAQPSGNYTLDMASLRAVQESNPLPPLPQGYDKDSAPVELWFQVKQ